MNMDVYKTLQVVETEKYGYRQFTLEVKARFIADPYLNIPDDFISHALCNTLREYVNSTPISEDIEKHVKEPVRYTKEK